MTIISIYLRKRFLLSILFLIVFMGAMWLFIKLKFITRNTYKDTAPGVVNIWIEQFGTKYRDWVGGITVDPTGNVYVIGVFGKDSSNHLTKLDVFLAKYGTSGSKIWLKQIDTKVYDKKDIGGITCDKMGYIYVTGYTEDSLDGNKKIRGMVPILIKFDSLGNKRFSKQLGAKGIGVAVNSLGDIYVTCESYETLFLYKFNCVGDIIWIKEIDTLSDIKVSGIVMDSEENIYVAGTAVTTLHKFDETVSIGLRNIFITKYNSYGDMVWIKQFSVDPPYENRCTGISIDNVNNIYVTGAATDLNFFDKAYSLLAKYDSSGNKKWVKELYMEGRDNSSNGICVDIFGNIYLTGSIDFKITLVLHGKVFFAKFNPEGEKVWIKTFGANRIINGQELLAYNRGKSIVTDKEGNIYVAGVTEGCFNNKKHLGGADIFLSKWKVESE